MLLLTKSRGFPIPYLRNIPRVPSDVGSEVDAFSCSLLADISSMSWRSAIQHWNSALVGVGAKLVLFSLAALSSMGCGGLESRVTGVSRVTVVIDILILLKLFVLHVIDFSYALSVSRK